MKVTSLTLQFRVICVNKLLAKFFWLITDSGWWIDRVFRAPVGSYHGWHGSGTPAPCCVGTCPCHGVGVPDRSHPEAFDGHQPRIGYEPIILVRVCSVSRKAFVGRASKVLSARLETTTIRADRNVCPPVPSLRGHGAKCVRWVGAERNPPDD